MDVGLISFVVPAAEHRRPSSLRRSRPVSLSPAILSLPIHLSRSDNAISSTQSFTECTRSFTE